jgi:hypothetical protein
MMLEMVLSPTDRSAAIQQVVMAAALAGPADSAVSVAPTAAASNYLVKE